jgi:hypothetical protein
MATILDEWRPVDFLIAGMTNCGSVALVGGIVLLLLGGSPEPLDEARFNFGLIEQGVEYALAGVTLLAGNWALRGGEEAVKAAKAEVGLPNCPRKALEWLGLIAGSLRRSMFWPMCWRARAPKARAIRSAPGRRQAGEGGRPRETEGLALSAALAGQGSLNERGRPFAANSVAATLPA